MHGLERQTRMAIAAGRVPAAYRARLRAAVDDLAGRMPRCVPPPPPQPPLAPPAPAAPKETKEKQEKKHGKGERDGNGKRHGKGPNKHAEGDKG